MTAPAPRLRELRRIGDVDGAAWNALLPAAYPFTRHEFLNALETHGCVGGATGWEPCHQVLEDASGRLVALAPLYRKLHSYGEFVFDWSWAEAAQHLGSAYYPKLLCAVPFTPVTGPRLAARAPEFRDALAAALTALPGRDALSSLHALFLDESDCPALTKRGAMERHGLQFHWHNPGYGSFAEFLAALRHDKRKKIQRERRRIAEAGLRFEVRSGDQLEERDWHHIYRLYANTYEERGQRAYLSLGFFLDYGRRPETPLRLILCRDGQRLVAVAITVLGGDTLYGRHWGCAEQYHSLHFETCYYQGIELCIREGIMRFDAGAQGEHKHARGFDPVVVRSAHLVRDPRLQAAIDHFLRRERAALNAYRTALGRHSAYRRTGDDHG